MEILIIWFALTILIGVWANNWGRSGFGFFVLSFILSPLLGAIILLIAGRNTEKSESRKLDTGEMKKCPHCAELIRIQAVKCRYCGSEV